MQQAAALIEVIEQILNIVKVIEIEITVLRVSIRVIPKEMSFI